MARTGRSREGKLGGCCCVRRTPAWTVVARAFYWRLFTCGHGSNRVIYVTHMLHMCGQSAQHVMWKALCSFKKIIVYWLCYGSCANALHSSFRGGTHVWRGPGYCVRVGGVFPSQGDLTPKHHVPSLRICKWEESPGLSIEREGPTG